MKRATLDVQGMQQHRSQTGQCTVPRAECQQSQTSHAAVCRRLLRSTACRPARVKTWLRPAHRYSSCAQTSRPVWQSGWCLECLVINKANLFLTSICLHHSDLIARVVTIGTFNWDVLCRTIPSPAMNRHDLDTVWSPRCLHGIISTCRHYCPARSAQDVGYWGM